MGGLSFCFSNEPCIRKGTDFEWETDRRSAYQAEPVPFLIWGECPTARGHRPRAARRPSASSHPPPAKTPAASGQSPRSRSREASQPPPHREGNALERNGAPPLLPHPARKNPCGKRAKPAEPQPGGRISGVSLHYASTTISSFVSRAVCTSPSIFSSRFFSCLRITFRFGLVTGCFATKIVQQSSYGRIDVS